MVIKEGIITHEAREQQRVVPYAFIFPGQGSQFVGMGLDLYEGSAAAKDLLQRADEVLKFSLSEMCFKGPEAKLNNTLHAQSAVFVVSLAGYQATHEMHPELRQVLPQYYAGHSLGEYAALVAAGVLSFEDALRLVRRRGELTENVEAE